MTAEFKVAPSPRFTPCVLASLIKGSWIYDGWTAGPFPTTNPRLKGQSNGWLSKIYIRKYRELDPSRKGHLPHFRSLPSQTLSRWGLISGEGQG